MPILSIRHNCAIAHAVIAVILITLLLIIAIAVVVIDPAGLNQMTRGVGIRACFRIRRIMIQPDIVTDLVAHAVVAPGAGLLHRRERLAGSDAVDVADAAGVLVQIADQQDGHVCRVAYSRHIPVLQKEGVVAFSRNLSIRKISAKFVHIRIYS